MEYQNIAGTQSASLEYSSKLDKYGVWFNGKLIASYEKSGWACKKLNEVICAHDLTERVNN